MVIPLVVLAAGSCVVGFLAIPPALLGHDTFGTWLAPVVGAMDHEVHATEYILMVLSVLVGLGGIAVAVWVYMIRKGRPAEEFVDKYRDLHKIVLDKYYFDEGYEKAVIRPLLYINEKSGQFDNEVVDGFVNGAAKVTSKSANSVGYFDNEVVDAAINASAHVTQSAGQRVRRLQTGRIRDYVAFAVVGGLVVIGLFCLYGSDALKRYFEG